MPPSNQVALRWETTHEGIVSNDSTMANTFKHSNDLESVLEIIFLHLSRDFGIDSSSFLQSSRSVRGRPIIILAVAKMDHQSATGRPVRSNEVGEGSQRLVSFLSTAIVRASAITLRPGTTTQ